MCGSATGGIVGCSTGWSVDSYLATNLAINLSPLMISAAFDFLFARFLEFLLAWAVAVLVSFNLAFDKASTYIFKLAKISTFSIIDLWVCLPDSLQVSIA